MKAHFRQTLLRSCAALLATCLAAGAANAMPISFSFNDVSAGGRSNAVAGSFIGLAENGTNQADSVLLELFKLDGMLIVSPAAPLSLTDFQLDSNGNPFSEVTTVDGVVTGIDLDVRGFDFRLDFQDRRDGLGNRFFIASPNGSRTFGPLFGPDGSSSAFATTNPVPAPAPAALLAIGALAFGVARKRRIVKRPAT